MGFAPASAGLLMLIGGLTDCGANLLAAAAATRMRSKLGRYRPFLIYGAAPLGVTFGLLFIKPDLAPATVFAIAMVVPDRKSVVWGKSVAVRVTLGGRPIPKNKK